VAFLILAITAAKAALEGMVRTTRRPSPQRLRWMRKPRKTKPSSMWVTRVFSAERVIFNLSASN